MRGQTLAPRPFPQAKRTQEMWTGLRLLLGLLKKHAPAPAASEVAGATGAKCASAAACFQVWMGNCPHHSASKLH